MILIVWKIFKYTLTVCLYCMTTTHHLPACLPACRITRGVRVCVRDLLMDDGWYARLLLHEAFSSPRKGGTDGRTPVVGTLIGTSSDEQNTLTFYVMKHVQYNHQSSDSTVAGSVPGVTACFSVMPYLPPGSNAKLMSKVVPVVFPSGILILCSFPATFSFKIFPGPYPGGTVIVCIVGAAGSAIATAAIGGGAGGGAGGAVGLVIVTCGCWDIACWP